MTDKEPQWVEAHMRAAEFARNIAPVYALLGWEWGGGDREAFVPGAKEIATRLREMVGSLKGREPGSVSRTGGLFVQLGDEESDSSTIVFGFSTEVNIETISLGEPYSYGFLVKGTEDA